MDFTIPCDTIARLSGVAKRQAVNETRDYLRCLYIERINNRTMIIATNVKTAAIERLAAHPAGDDAWLLIELPDALVAQCITEAGYGSDLTVIHVPEMNFATAKTTFGYVHGENIAHQLKPLVKEGYSDIRREWRGWRNWAPDKIPTETFHALDMDAMQIASLAAAAPSGRLFFPLYIDRRMPVLVRDGINEDWCGLFMPDSGEPQKGIKFPAWLK